MFRVRRVAALRRWGVKVHQQPVPHGVGVARELEQRRAPGVQVLLRTVALVAAGVLTIFAVGALRPSMQAELTAFWTAAQAGDVATAEIHKKAFDDMHPKASLLLTAQLGMVLWALLAGGLAATLEPGARTKDDPREPS